MPNGTSDWLLQTIILMAVIFILLTVILALSITVVRLQRQTSTKVVKSFQVLHRLSQLQHNPINRTMRSTSMSTTGNEETDTSSKNIEAFFNCDLESERVK